MITGAAAHAKKSAENKKRAALRGDSGKEAQTAATSLGPARVATSIVEASELGVRGTRREEPDNGQQRCEGGNHTRGDALVRTREFTCAVRAVLAAVAVTVNAVTAAALVAAGSGAGARGGAGGGARAGADGGVGINAGDAHARAGLCLDALA